jgi:hypothetical protein
VYNNWSGLQALMCQSLLTSGEVAAAAEDLTHGLAVQDQVVGLPKLVF